MEPVSPSIAQPQRDTMQGAVSIAASASEDTASSAAGGAGRDSLKDASVSESAGSATIPGGASVKKRTDYLVR